jgi:hypothetical protein
MSRRPNGAFLPGQGGRPRGARNHLTKVVFEDILRHWTEPAGGDLCKGQAALEIVFREKPNEYVRLVTSVLPKEFVFENITSELDDDQIDELLIALRQRMIEARATVPLLPAKEEEQIEQPQH